jgi:hypothetical protein
MSKRLHLHFDVNKTIIMSDAASGQSLEHSLASIFAEEESFRGTPDAAGNWKMQETDGQETYGDYSRRRYSKDESKVKVGEQVWFFVFSFPFFLQSECISSTRVSQGNLYSLC